jgi:hypothetical protein
LAQKRTRSAKGNHNSKIAGDLWVTSRRVVF